jgi:predicted small secreted protein
MKITRILLVVVLSFILTGCGSVLNGYKEDVPVKPEEHQVKNWTLMLYIAGDVEKDVAKLLQEELKSVLKVGSSANVHIVAQIDYPGKDAKADRFYVYKDKLATRGELKHSNMGDPNTLKSFLQWGMSYPAKKYALVILGHGTGWISLAGPGSVYTPNSRSFAYSESDKDCITLVEFKKVLNEVLGKKKIDVAAFNSCLMNETEVAYQMKDHFKYLVASETTMPGFGFDYPYFVKKLAVLDLSPEALAKNIYLSAPSEYQNMKNRAKKLHKKIKDLTEQLSYSWDDEMNDEDQIRWELNDAKSEAKILDNLEYQVGLVDLSKMDSLASSIKNFVETFKTIQNNNPELADNLVKSARTKSKTFGKLFKEVYKSIGINPPDPDEYIDLNEFMLEMYDRTADTDNANLSLAAKGVIENLYNVVLDSWYSSKSVKYSKISIYYPPVGAFYKSKTRKLYSQLDFSNATEWIDFIDSTVK